MYVLTINLLDYLDLDVIYQEHSRTSRLGLGFHRVDSVPEQILKKNRWFDPEKKSWH